MDFINGIRETLNENFNYSRTENGALGYRTSGKQLLDLNFAVSSLRNRPEKEIENRFAKAYFEDPLTAIKWLFYASDVREGLGERRLFRVCLKYLSNNHPKVVSAIIKLIPEYNRWDNAWVLLKTDHRNEVIDLIRNQLEEDIVNMREKKPISLLAKWLKSANASSKETKELAKITYTGLGMTERSYRKMLSELRKYLKIVERDMSANRWKDIDYSTVPSRANLIYNSAFLRNDEERRRAYLEALERGDENVKINAGVLFPHDIVHNYFERLGFRRRRIKPVDTALEQLWNNLPDMVNKEEDVIVVADGSGSMEQTVSCNSHVTALEIANALAIYFAERSSGQFKDKYITFSHRPKLVDFSNADTLRDKLEISLKYNEVANTNIEATFMLILQTAINKNMKQEELPKTILIISDMEFDEATTRCDGRLFKEIMSRFLGAGYQMPKLVFWNVCSRTGTIPVKENNLGVALVSGFSPNVIKMVLSNQLDAYECLLSELNKERYQPVEDALSDVIIKKV